MTRIEELEADNARMRETVMALADRIEICSRLLSRCAERKPCPVCREREEAAKEAGRMSPDVANDSRAV